MEANSESAFFLGHPVEVAKALTLYFSEKRFGGKRTLKRGVAPNVDVAKVLTVYFSE